MFLLNKYQLKSEYIRVYKEAHQAAQCAFVLLSDRFRPAGTELNKMWSEWLTRWPSSELLFWLSSVALQLLAGFHLSKDNSNLELFRFFYGAQCWFEFGGVTQRPWPQKWRREGKGLAAAQSTQQWVGNSNSKHSSHFQKQEKDLALKKSLKSLSGQVKHRLSPY